MSSVPAANIAFTEGDNTSNSRLSSSSLSISPPANTSSRSERFSRQSPALRARTRSIYLPGPILATTAHYATKSASKPHSTTIAKPNSFSKRTSAIGAPLLAAASLRCLRADGTVVRGCATSTATGAVSGAVGTVGGGALEGCKAAGGWRSWLAELPAQVFHVSLVYRGQETTLRIEIKDGAVRATSILCLVTVGLGLGSYLLYRLWQRFFRPPAPVTSPEVTPTKGRRRRQQPRKLRVESGQSEAEGAAGKGGKLVTPDSGMGQTGPNSSSVTPDSPQTRALSPPQVRHRGKKHRRKSKGSSKQNSPNGTGEDTVGDGSDTSPARLSTDNLIDLNSDSSPSHRKSQTVAKHLSSDQEEKLKENNAKLLQALNGAVLLGASMYESTSTDLGFVSELGGLSMHESSVERSLVLPQSNGAIYTANNASSSTQGNLVSNPQSAWLEHQADINNGNINTKSAQQSPISKSNATKRKKRGQMNKKKDSLVTSFNVSDNTSLNPESFLHSTPTQPGDSSRPECDSDTEGEAGSVFSGGPSPPSFAAGVGSHVRYDRPPSAPLSRSHHLRRGEGRRGLAASDVSESSEDHSSCMYVGNSVDLGEHLSGRSTPDSEILRDNGRISSAAQFDTINQLVEPLRSELEALKQKLTVLSTPQDYMPRTVVDDSDLVNSSGSRRSKRKSRRFHQPKFSTFSFDDGDQSISSSVNQSEELISTTNQSDSLLMWDYQGDLAPIGEKSHFAHERPLLSGACLQEADDKEANSRQKQARITQYIEEQSRSMSDSSQNQSAAQQEYFEDSLNLGQYKNRSQSSPTCGQDLNINSQRNTSQKSLAYTGVSVCKDCRDSIIASICMLCGKQTSAYHKSHCINQDLTQDMACSNAVKFNPHEPNVELRLTQHDFKSSDQFSAQHPEMSFPSNSGTYLGDSAKINHFSSSPHNSLNRSSGPPISSDSMSKTWAGESIVPQGLHSACPECGAPLYSPSRDASIQTVCIKCEQNELNKQPPKVKPETRERGTNCGDEIRRPYTDTSKMPPLSLQSSSWTPGTVPAQKQWETTCYTWQQPQHQSPMCGQQHQQQQQHNLPCEQQQHTNPVYGGVQCSDCLDKNSWNRLQDNGMHENDATRHHALSARGVENCSYPTTRPEQRQQKELDLYTSTRSAVQSSCSVSPDPRQSEHRTSSQDSDNFYSADVSPDFESNIQLGLPGAGTSVDSGRSRHVESDDDLYSAGDLADEDNSRLSEEINKKGAPKSKPQSSKVNVGTRDGGSSKLYSNKMIAADQKAAFREKSVEARTDPRLRHGIVNEKREPYRQRSVEETREWYEDKNHVYEQLQYTKGTTQDKYKPVAEKQPSAAQKKLENISDRKIIGEYMDSEWKGETAKAQAIRQGYLNIAYRQGYEWLRQIRGDNYCALRASIFQLFISGNARSLDQGQSVHGLTTWFDKVEYGYLHLYNFAHRLPFDSHHVRDAMDRCLTVFYEQVKKLRLLDSPEEREQFLVSVLNSNETVDVQMCEAVKFLMLRKAIVYHKAVQHGKAVPTFVWLMFARDTSENPKELLANHINAVGNTGGLEMVEMFLLSDVLGCRITVARPSQHGKEDFITHFPALDEPGWQNRPSLMLVAEDDRHYNVLLREDKPMYQRNVRY